MPDGTAVSLILAGRTYLNDGNTERAPGYAVLSSQAGDRVVSRRSVSSRGSRI